MKFNFAVCDDNIQHLNSIHDTILKLSDKYDVNVSLYNSPEDLLQSIEENQKNNQSMPSFVLLDIELSDMNGITLGKKIKDSYPDICLVLVTSYIEYAVDGYASKANQYLLKPITVEHIEKMIVNYVQEQKKVKKLLIKDNDGEHLICLNDIVYISSEDKYTVLHTNRQYFIDYKSLKDYEALLSEYGFFRIHRKYIINMYYHKSIKKEFVLLDNDIKLPISRRKEKLYRKNLLKLLEGKLL